MLDLNHLLLRPQALLCQCLLQPVFLNIIHLFSVKPLAPQYLSIVNYSTLNILRIFSLLQFGYMSSLKMADSNECEYSSIDGSDHEALLDESGLERARRRPLSTTSRILSWLLRAVALVCFLAMGVVIGYGIRGTVAKNLIFADTSHFRRCTKIPCSDFHHTKLFFF